jgi:hypothetical protein
MIWHPQANWRQHAMHTIDADLATLASVLADVDPNSPEAQSLFPQLDRLLAEKDALVYG